MPGGPAQQNRYDLDMVDGKRKPMRQGQQNRRGRGRGRKPQNPLSRSYESSGPDVKIRGNASHIAEKYSTLARDALSMGDPVTAENYFQHAEHYYRIIMSAQAQSSANAQNSNVANGSGSRRDGQGENGNEAARGNRSRTTPAEVVNGAESGQSDDVKKPDEAGKADDVSLPAEMPAESETTEAAETSDEGSQPPDNAAA